MFALVCRAWKCWSCCAMEPIKYNFKDRTYYHHEVCTYTANCT